MMSILEIRIIFAIKIELSDKTWNIFPQKPGLNGKKSMFLDKTKIN